MEEGRQGLHDSLPLQISSGISDVLAHSLPASVRSAEPRTEERGPEVGARHSQVQVRERNNYAKAKIRSEITLLTKMFREGTV